MYVNVTDKNCLIIDYGSYFNVAIQLSKSFNRVYYFNPVVHDGFKDKKDAAIGLGIDGVIKVEEWASIIHDVDIIGFCDYYEPELQHLFRSMGKLVFGSGDSGILEGSRVLLKKTMEELGLPVGDYEVAIGLEDLENKLRSKYNVYIKSDNRGNFETTKWKRWVLSKGEIRRLKRDMSIFGDDEVYTIENQIDSIGEIGFDTFCVDGKYPEIVSSSIEIKDMGCVLKLTPYSDLPPQLKNVGDKMSEKFKELGYNGWHSNEVLIGKDMKGYLLDATCRMPSPPISALMTVITNFSECFYQVGMGIVPKLEFTYKYACELILRSDMAGIDDTPIIVPDEYKPYVFLKNMRVIQDEENGEPVEVWYYSRRGVVMKEIGSVVGVGKTLNEAINMAKKIAESIESEDAKCETDCLDAAQEQLDRLRKAGIRFM